MSSGSRNPVQSFLPDCECIVGIPRPSELEWMSAAVANEEGMEAATPTRGRERRRGDGSKMEHCNGRKFLQ